MAAFDDVGTASVGRFASTTLDAETGFDEVGTASVGRFASSTLDAMFPSVVEEVLDVVVGGALRIKVENEFPTCLLVRPRDGMVGVGRV